MDEAGMPVTGMRISLRMRRDVVVADPERLVRAARQALRDADPEMTEEEAAAAVTDVHDAVYALLDRDGDLIVEGPDRDGLTAAGRIYQIVLDEPRTVQEYAGFLPADPFALPGSGGELGQLGGGEQEGADPEVGG